MTSGCPCAARASARYECRHPRGSSCTARTRGCSGPNTGVAQLIDVRARQIEVRLRCRPGREPAVDRPCARRPRTRGRPPPPLPRSTRRDRGRSRRPGSPGADPNSRASDSTAATATRWTVPRQPAWAAPTTPSRRSASRMGAQSATRTPIAEPGSSETITSASGRAQAPSRPARTTATAARCTCRMSRSDRGHLHDVGNRAPLRGVICKEQIACRKRVARSRAAGGTGARRPATAGVHRIRRQAEGDS